MLCRTQGIHWGHVLLHPCPIIPGKGKLRQLSKGRAFTKYSDHLDQRFGHLIRLKKSIQLSCWQSTGGEGSYACHAGLPDQLQKWGLKWDPLSTSICAFHQAWEAKEQNGTFNKGSTMGRVAMGLPACVSLAACISVMPVVLDTHVSQARHLLFRHFGVT